MESGLVPRSSCGGQQGILESRGYLTDSGQAEATYGARKLDYVALKVSERVKGLFDVQLRSRLLELPEEGYFSDHRFVRTEVEFTPLASD